MENYFNKITIAIPVYERYDYFEQAVNSAINQSVPVTVSVIDNHSSHSRFKDFVEKLNNPNVKYYCNNTNVGMTGNWNKCFEYCETEWVTILHDDDWLHPQYIEATLRVINSKSQSDAGCVVAYCHIDSELRPNLEHVKYDLDKMVAKHLAKYDFIVMSSFSPFPGVMVKKEIALAVNGFDDNHYPMADYDFWVKIFKQTKVIKIFYRLGMYRVSPLQTTSSASNQIIKSLYHYRKSLSKDQKPITRFFAIYDSFKLYQFYKKYNLIKNINDIDDPELIKAYKAYSPILNFRLFTKFTTMMYKIYKYTLVKTVKLDK